jgi:hypothetical protein
MLDVDIFVEKEVSTELVQAIRAEYDIDVALEETCAEDFKLLAAVLPNEKQELRTFALGFLSCWHRLNARYHTSFNYMEDLIDA